MRRIPRIGTFSIIGTVAINISQPSNRQSMIENFVKRFGNINLIPIPVTAMPQTVPKIDHPQGPFKGANANGV